MCAPPPPPPPVGSDVLERMEAESSETASDTEEPLKSLSIVSPSARVDESAAPSETRLELEVLTVSCMLREPEGYV